MKGYVEIYINKYIYNESVILFHYLETWRREGRDISYWGVGGEILRMPRDVGEGGILR